MGQMETICSMGDLKMAWNANNISEVNAAKEVFTKKIKEGWAAFMDKFGSKGEKIKEFDPDAEKIILVPPVVGG